MTEGKLMHAKLTRDIAFTQFTSRCQTFVFDVLVAHIGASFGGSQATAHFARDAGGLF